MGHEVVFYECDVPYYASHRDFDSTDFCRLVLYSDWDDVQARAYDDAAESDVVIHASYCSNGADIINEIFEVAAGLRVFYDLDTPITLEKLSSGKCDYLRADQIPAFDLYLSWCGGKTLDQLEQRWSARKALPLYGCVDPDVHARVDVPEPFRCLMSYMGTYAADRHQKFEELFLKPVRRRPEDIFVLAGSLYPDTSWPSNLRRYPHVSPHDHPALYSGSRLTLNLTRETMAQCGFCPSGRLFEAAACGTPIISDWFTGLDQFFTPDEEIFIARNTNDVVRAFDISDAELARIATRACERTLAEHTGEHRAKQLVSYLEDAISGRSKAVAEVA